MIARYRLLGLLVFSATLLPLNGAAQSKSKGAPPQFAFPKACVDCHGSGARNTLFAAHAASTTRATARSAMPPTPNSEGCQRCHTNEGFIEFVKKGAVDPKAIVANPSEIGCFTRHAPHDTGNFSLRKTSAVTLRQRSDFRPGQEQSLRQLPSRPVLTERRGEASLYPRSTSGARTTARTPTCCSVSTPTSSRERPTPSLRTRCCPRRPASLAT